MALPFFIFQLTSDPATLHPINPASISIPPVPQKGSNNKSPELTLDRLTMHLANFGLIEPG